MTKRIISCLLVLLTLCLGGCAAKTNNLAEKDVWTDSVSEAVSDEGLYDYTGKTELSASSKPTDSQKLIKTVTIQAQTQDLDALLTNLDAQVATLGGYVEQREVYNGSGNRGSANRNAYLVLRIPAQHLSQLVSQVQELSNVIQHNETVDDVTMAYTDTASRKVALETEYDRLLELLAQAQTMDEILQIEDRLTQVRYELESITSQLQVYDNKITYATVRLTVNQVQTLAPTEPAGVGQRISQGFGENLRNIGIFFQDLAVFLVVNSPQLLLFAAVCTATVLLTVHLVRRGDKKRQQATAKDPEAPDSN